MIKNIIFDIGNVLLKFNPKEYFSKMFENEEIGNTMCDLIMQSEIWKQYDLGNCTLEDVKNDFILKKPLLKDEICKMLDLWLPILKPLNESFKVMEDLKKEGYKVYLLSNLSEDAFNYIDKEYHLFDKVDGYVVSFKEHVSKPDFKIYDILVSRYNLNKEECVFLDDTKVNVDAAIAFGMSAIHFMEEKSSLKELDTLLRGNKYA